MKRATREGLGIINPVREEIHCCLGGFLQSFEMENVEAGDRAGERGHLVSTRPRAWETTDGKLPAIQLIAVANEIIGAFGDCNANRHRNRNWSARWQRWLFRNNKLVR